MASLKKKEITVLCIRSRKRYTSVVDFFRPNNAANSNHVLACGTATLIGSIMQEWPGDRNEGR